MPSFFDTTLHIALPEFIFMVMGIVIIGFAMGFLWTHRKGGEEAIKLKLKKEEEESDKWRLKYYDQTEANEKQISELTQQIQTLAEKEEQLAEKEQHQTIDPELMRSLQQELAKTSRLEQMIAGKMNQPAPVNEIIPEELSEWGADQLRQELRKLAQKNSYLESQLARLGHIKESSLNGVSEKTD